MRGFRPITCFLLATPMAMGVYSSSMRTAFGQELPNIPIQDAPETFTDASTDGNIEVMTRGPIHEAFASPINAGGGDPLAVPNQPPEPIEEVPPDVKPEDESAVWIGGYWAWDDDRNDFNWVSGVWRVPPPGKTWVAGYWTEAPGGYSWVSGFWAAADQEQVAYYPQPPESLEQGPTSEPPSPDDVWISGCWMWSESGYAWRPGYWAAGRPNWIWTSASYYWSPRGWVFRDGYWDYQLARRGLLFAPVHFRGNYYRRPGFHYTPSVVWNARYLPFALFLRPSYGHYYYGDYYASSYDRLGFYP
ncbi:MAG: BcpO-related WXXGXW repeat protein [Pirellulaceae bacterium]|nr:BcpO-related WXXGXW repeat protein [Pirellulaceae bacterium]